MSSTIKSQLFERYAKPILVPISFGGIDCFIKPWTERERIEWAQHVKQLETEAPDDKTVRCRAITWSLVDADGNLIFERDDAAKLMNFPALVIDEAFEAIIAVQKKPDKDAKKNSAETPS